MKIFLDGVVEQYALYWILNFATLFDTILQEFWQEHEWLFQTVKLICNVNNFIHFIAIEISQECFEKRSFD